MSLKVLVLQNRIDRQSAELQALQEKDAEFDAREASLREDIEAAQTEEERQAVEAAVEAFDAELDAHRSAKAQLVNSIQALTVEVETLEQNQTPPAPAAAAAEHKEERIETTMTPMSSLNIRSLPMAQRAFGSYAKNWSSIASEI